MVLQTARGRGSCCACRCCCPAFIEKIGGGANSAESNSTRPISVEDVPYDGSIGVKVQPQQIVGGEANSVKLNSSPPISVEDVSDDKDEDLRELMSPLRNQTPSEGEWMEPITTPSATTAAVPTINENSCSVHGMKVLQQYSSKRSNKNRNRKRILGMMRYIDQRSDLSNEQRERELERLQYELEIFQRGKQFKSSAVHCPDQFIGVPVILDAKTYDRYEIRIKDTVKQLSARVEGAKEKRDELHRELAALKGVALTAKTRKKLNKEMCLTRKYDDGKLLVDDAVLLPCPHNSSV